MVIVYPVNSYCLLDDLKNKMQSSEVLRTKPILIISVLLFFMAGALIGYDVHLSVYFIGLIGIVSYVILCFIRPFWAFSVLILLGLTVWFSSIQIMEGVSLMIGVGGVFLMVWLLRLLTRNANFVFIKEFWYLVGLAITIGISTIYNWGGPAGFTPVFTYIQLLLLVVLVVNFADNPERLKQMGQIFIIASALMMALIFLDHWGLLPAGLVKDETGAMYFGGRYQVFSRTGGIFGDPNFAALQLTIALPFILEYWPGSTTIQKGLYFIVSVGILFAISFTVSLTGLVGVAAMLLVKTLIVRKQNFIVRLIQIILIAIITIWLAVNYLPDYYLDRIMMNLQQLDLLLQTHDQNLFLQIGTTRGDAWLAAVRTILHSPIIGNGPGNSIYLNPANSILRYSQPYLAAHNILLSVVSDLGLMGIFTFIGLLVIAVWSVSPVKLNLQVTKDLRTSRNAVFIALLACVLQGLALDLHTQKLLWILIGMALIYKRLPKLNALIDGDNKYG